MTRRFLPRALRRPPSGWSSLLILGGMLGLAGLSLADARPLPLDGLRPDLPIILALAGGLLGFLLARSSLGPGAAHLFGATAGAATLLLVVAAAVQQDGGREGAAIAAAGGGSLSVLGARLQDEAAALLAVVRPAPALTSLVLGALCWTTGQFSAFGVFRHGRALPAIAACGGLIVMNEALPPGAGASDRLPSLVVLTVFALLSLLLVSRLRLASQEERWAARQMVAGAQVRRGFLTAGGLLAAVVVALSGTLAAVATPPAPRFDSGALQGPLDDLRASLSQWLALVEVDIGPTSSSLDDDLAVADAWQQGDGVAFVADVPGGLRGNYWWLSAFADFDGHAWSRGDVTSDPAIAGETLPIPPDASGAGPEPLLATVWPRRSGLALGTVLSPSEASTVSRDVNVRSLGDREGLAEVLFSRDLLRGGSYEVAAAVHDYGAGEEGDLSAAALRAAGDDYPAWVARYLRVNAGASGPRTARLAAEIRARAAQQGLANAYDEARLLQDRLRGMEYRTSIEGLCEPGENVPECLLRTEIGFCQHYASTMVMTLRELEVPARLVTGYLPGDRSEGDRYEVPMQALHAWVEAYFPGTGWVRFDPTPGDQLRRWEQRATRLPEGEPVPSPGVTATPPPGSETFDPAAEPSPSAGAALALAAPSGGGPWWSADLVGLPLLPVLALLGLLTLLATLLLVRLRRLPDGDAGLAYLRIASLASRVGHGPERTQTEYEYAASLSETLPEVRDDLVRVAQARVESRYGRHTLSQGQWPSLRHAYARARTALLRLAWRGRR